MIAKINLEGAKSFPRNSKLITKVGNRNKIVVFEVSVDNTDICEAVDFACGNKNIVSLVYEGTEQYFTMLSELDSKGVNIAKIERVSLDVDEAYIAELLKVLPAWATLIVDLPEDFNNMEFVYNVCSKFDRVRFSGGYLFDMSGVRLGICGKDTLESLGIKGLDDLIKTGDCCALEVVDANDIEISVATAKDKVSTSSGTKSSPKQKTMLFSEFLCGGAPAFGESSGL